MATAQANAAASLDQFLVDVGAGPLRCWLPGRPGVEFINSLAGKPSRAGRRLATMVDESLGGDSGFILSTSGHIAAIVNPPGNPKASHRVGDEKLAEVGQWMQTSGTEQSSWWDDYLGWLTERGGPQKPSPAKLGTTGLAPLADAPGTYIFES